MERKAAIHWRKGNSSQVRMLFKLFPPMLCSSFKFLYQLESLTRCRSFGGETKTTRRGCIGSPSGKCVSQKIRVMGFLYIHYFNLAILPKQAWRLIEKPDSLCTSVLRAKYFPNGDLLITSFKKGSLFTWQSIMAGSILLNMVTYGVLGTGRVFIFGKIHGFQKVTIEKLLLPEGKIFCLRFPILLTQLITTGMKV